MSQPSVENHDQLCTWLGLPPGSWPPNFYTLLGLPVAEPDIERIEQQVHERLARLRPYQLNHPDQVTEAMNRLAQAFTCLTDPQAKKSYDASLLNPQPAAEATSTTAAGQAASPAAAPATELVMPALVREGGDPLAWLFGPWSQPRTTQAAPPQPATGDWTTSPPPAVRVPPPEAPAEAAPAANGPVEKPALPPPLPPAPPPEPVDPVIQAAQLSPPARRGLGTKRALYYRIARTRRLLRAWDRVGGFLSRPRRRLTRTADAAELTSQLEEIRELLQGFPPILGGVGQPGYFVVILARQQMFVPTFRALIPSQRDELARDWRAGRALLSAHLQFLRQELRALRHKSRWAQLVRAARAVFTDQPITLLLLAALLALGIALWFPYMHHR